MVDPGAQEPEELVSGAGPGGEDLARDNLDRGATTVSELASWSWGYRGHSNWAMGILGLSPSTTYHAAGNTVPDNDFLTGSPSWRELHLMGLRVGTISSISQYPYFQGAGQHEVLHRAYVAIFDTLNRTGK